MHLTDDLGHQQGSTKPLKIWGLLTMGTWPTEGMPPLHAFKYYRCAKIQGAAPCRILADRDSSSALGGSHGAVEPWSPGLPPQEHLMSEMPSILMRQAATPCDSHDGRLPSSELGLGTFTPCQCQGQCFYCGTGISERHITMVRCLTLSQSAISEIHARGWAA